MTTEPQIHREDMEEGKVMGAESRLSQAEPEVVSALRASIRRATDGEIEAIREAYLALCRVSPAAQLRALDWLDARIGWEQSLGKEAAIAVGQAAKQIERAVQRARRRKPAIATEAGTAETGNTGSVHEGAAIAQTNLQNPND